MRGWYSCGIVAVGHEQHITDKGVKPVTNPDAVFVRFSGKVGFHLALRRTRDACGKPPTFLSALYEGLVS